MENQSVAIESNLQVCTFWLDDRLFGFDILDVKEVESELNITPIFHATNKILGYMNIRGNVHLVLDMRKVMGFEDREVDSQSRIILFKSFVGESFGVLVDSVWDVIDVDVDKIENRRVGSGLSSEGLDGRLEDVLGAGVYKLEGKLMVLLNSNNLLQMIRD